MANAALKQNGAVKSATGAILIAIGLIAILINSEGKWIALGAVVAVVGVGMRIESAILHRPER